MNHSISKANHELLSRIRKLLTEGRKQAYQAVNSAMVLTYWNIGQLIVENEQQGQERAEYGKGVLKTLSASLTKEFGKGFDLTNLRKMRAFYLCFPIRDSLRLELSWTHYRTLSSSALNSLKTSVNSVVNALALSSFNAEFEWNY